MGGDLIKGISDFPKNENSEGHQAGNPKQLSTFLTNTPKVINRIFAEYLEKLI